MIDQDTHGAPGCAWPSRVKPGSTARLPDGFDPGDRFGLHKQKTGTVVPGTAGRICTYSGTGLIRRPVSRERAAQGCPDRRFRRLASRRRGPGELRGGSAIQRCNVPGGRFPPLATRALSQGQPDDRWPVHELVRPAVDAQCSTDGIG
jgi:hypothetical protein